MTAVPHPAGLTLSEKVFSRAAGVPATAGAVVDVRPDLITVHDGYAAMLWQQFNALDFPSLDDPERIFVAIDHEVHYTTDDTARAGTQLRELCRRYGISQFYDVGRGGNANVLPVETGAVKAGDFVFASDVNGVNLGAIGAVAVPIGAAISAPMILGEWWAQVPHTIRVELSGTPRAGVHSRDIASHIVTALADIALPTGGPVTLEFHGEYAASLHIDGRMTLCHFAMHTGAFGAVFEPFPTHSGAKAVASDPDAAFWMRLSIDTSEVVASVKTPDGRGVVPVDAVGATPIQQAVIGSCASGFYADLALAASVLRGRRVHPDVRLIVTPVTRAVHDRCEREGIVADLRAAGAIFLEAGCGPCAGGRVGALGPGEVSIATVSDNATGRFQSAGAAIYLGSAATVAASAIAGAIVSAEEER